MLWNLRNGYNISSAHSSLLWSCCTHRSSNVTFSLFQNNAQIHDINKSLECTWETNRSIQNKTNHFIQNLVSTCDKIMVILITLKTQNWSLSVHKNVSSRSVPRSNCKNVSMCALTMSSWNWRSCAFALSHSISESRLTFSNDVISLLKLSMVVSFEVTISLGLRQDADCTTLCCKGHFSWSFLAIFTMPALTDTRITKLSLSLIFFLYRRLFISFSAAKPRLTLWAGRRFSSSRVTIRISVEFIFSGFTTRARTFLSIFVKSEHIRGTIGRSVW